MKKITSAFIIILCLSGLSVQAQIRVANGGNVGIGIGSEAPIYKLQVNGNSKITGSLETESLKTGSLEVNASGSSPYQLQVNGNSKITGGLRR